MESNSFEVKVGVHQGSVLSPLLFIIVLEALSKEFSVGSPWELLHTDDLCLLEETEKETVRNGKDTIKSKGLRVKTKVKYVMLSRN